MLADMNVSQNAIAASISLDPILAARILRLANSAAYAGARTVTNLPAAVNALGSETIRETLLVSGVSDSFGRKILNSPAGKEIWKHLLATAMVANDLSRVAGLRGGEEAFSCGLLHDIGKLIFLRADAPLYVSILERRTSEDDLSKVEREAFGFDHGELGAAAALKWNLPQPICDLIKDHHQPLNAASAMAITRIVFISDMLAYLKTNELSTDDLLCSEAVLGFGLNAAQLDAIWEDVVIRLDEITNTFN